MRCDKHLVWRSASLNHPRSVVPDHAFLRQWRRTIQVEPDTQCLGVKGRILARRDR